MTPRETRVLAAVEQLTEELIEFTQALVRIPTVNPPGDCYAACTDLIADRLRRFGYTVEHFAATGLPEHTPDHPRINVVGTLGDQQPVLHFNGHYDVVPPGRGWTADPFSAELRDGRCTRVRGRAAR